MSPKKSLDITIGIPIPISRIADLMVTAIEGNVFVRSWCIGIFWKGARLRPSATERSEPWYAREKTYLRTDFRLDIVEFVDDFHQKPHQVTMSSIAGGLVLMSKQAPMQFGCFLAENEDALTADVFLQLTTLGEIRYG